MRIENIRLVNFRNYLDLDLDLHNNINVFIGKNAQGKTNLLEAIYICGLGKSFRTNNDRELINFDKNTSYISSKIKTNDYERLIEIKLSKNQKKTMRINKNLLENNKELNSGLNVVVFSPDDLNLVKEGPSNRRDFLDREISQIKPLYSYNLSRYKKVLYQRNNILKSNMGPREKEGLLEVFDMQLVQTGSYIIRERFNYIAKMRDIARLIHRNVTNDLEDLNLEYESTIGNYEDLDELRENYLLGLRSSLQRDLDTRSTSVGPHRDDLKIYVNNRDLRIYGSQGQQRTAVLSIKLSEVELIKGERGAYPVLLLDDVFSELDRERRKYLIESLKSIQTIITVTDSLNLKEMEDIDKTVFYVEKGNIIGNENN